MGPVGAPKPTVAAVLVHELGHALHRLRNRRMWCRYQREIATLDARIKRYNRSANKRRGELQAIEDDLGRLTRLRREGGQAAELLAELASLLTQPESTRARREREALGWDVDWDPRRLWFSQLSQKGEQLTIRGGAHTHSDVAEFLKRVDRSPKTRAAQLGATQQGADGRVAYTIQATLAPREAGQE